MTWEIVLGIISLFGFVVAIVTPITKLIKTITILTTSMQRLDKSVSEIVTQNNESHARIWKHEKSQDLILDNHEKRLTKIELEKEFTKEAKGTK